MKSMMWRDISGNASAFDELVKLLDGGEAVAFVGAGASAGLYPLWPGLIEKLAAAAVDSGMAVDDEKRYWSDQADSLQAARQIHKRLGVGPFSEKIREIFGPKIGADGKRYTPVHGVLARLGFKAFVTTNYDPALTFACQEHRPGLLIRDFDWRHPRVALWLQGRPAEEGEVPILHAHGQYDGGGESVVLDSQDYRRAYGDDRYRELFEQLWTRERLVVVGFGFSDVWLRVIADQALSQSGARTVGGRRHVAVLGLPVGEIPRVRLHREAIEEQYHLRALFYPVGKDHSALGVLLDELERVTGNSERPDPPPPDVTPPVVVSQMESQTARSEESRRVTVDDGKKYDVFLAYNSSDLSKVETLAKKLEARKVKFFLANWHLIPGRPWQEGLEDALDESRTCAVFLGFELGPWQNEEMRVALDYRTRDNDFRVVPVLLPGASPPEEMPRFLRRLTWVQFSTLEDEGAFSKLQSGILGAPAPAREPAGRGPLRIFFSYAREDEDLFKKLTNHIKPLARNGTISSLDSHDISAGREREGEIHEGLKRADIILLLVSPDFMASDDRWDIEVAHAMRRHDEGSARVIPVLLRPTAWESAPFHKLRGLPKGEKPVTTWSNRDEALLDVAQGLGRVVDEVRRTRSG